jgi:hypothetical protein
MINLGRWSHNQPQSFSSIHQTLPTPLASIRMWILTFNLNLSLRSYQLMPINLNLSSTVLRYLKLKFTHKFGDSVMIFHRFPPIHHRSKHVTTNFLNFSLILCPYVFSVEPKALVPLCNIPQPQVGSHYY